MSEAAAEYRVPGLKQAQVDRACDQMLMDGVRPSIEKIRKEIGGSPNALLVLIDDWWRRLGKRVERGSAAFERLPGTLALHAEAFFLTALDEARAVARAEEVGSRDAASRHEDELRVRGQVLSLREQEFAEKLKERDRRAQVLEDHLREQGVLMSKTLASKDSLENQTTELRVTVATLQAQLARALAAPKKEPRRIQKAPRRKVPKRRPVATARKRPAPKRRARRGH